LELNVVIEYKIGDKSAVLPTFVKR
jgi:hypothetical protein